MLVDKCLWCDSINLKQVARRKDGVMILSCLKCEMMMVSEFPDDLSTLYDKEYFEKDERGNIGYNNYFSSPAGNLLGKYAIIKLLSDKEKNKYLDIGCADGSLVEILNNYGIKASGLDISKDAISGGVSRGLDLNVSDLKKINYDDCSFDFITAFDLLEHLDEPKNVLTEIKRILSDDGLFLFSTLGISRLENDEYWFNNSLEHLIYYNEDILRKLVGSIFGSENVTIFPVVINGVNELFGIAKKRNITVDEMEVIDVIKSKEVFSKGDNRNFYLSLLYNQLGRFNESEEAITNAGMQRESSNYIFLSFIRLFYQGNFFEALNLIKRSKNKIPLSNSIFWQAYSFVLSSLISEKELDLNKKSLEIQKRDDIINDLRTSRVIKPAITTRKRLRIARDYLKRKRSNFEGFLIRVSKKYLSDDVRFFIGKFLPGKYKTIIRKVKNKKWNGPLVSVVTPFYNHGKTIEETVATVLGQTFQNFEYIIVNDGSSDEFSNDVFAKIKDEKITKINQKNSGVAQARNNGIFKARGKYILCLDSDDKIDPTYLEKAVTIFESNPHIDIVYSDMQFFGLEEKIYKEPDFDPRMLFNNNIITTASVFRRRAWEKVGGYKSKIGFEDWEFWINLVENGSFAKRIPEPLFLYRRAIESRYIEDKKKSDANISEIKNMHKDYFKKLTHVFRYKYIFVKNSKFCNLESKIYYRQNQGRGILLLMPWLTFGGAETLVFNYSSNLKDKYDFHIITGIKSENEWEYKFREVTENIYHLPNLFDNKEDYLDFILNYIKSRNIKIVHIIHNSVFYEMLPEIKKKFPGIKVIVTVFNVLADHFNNSLYKAKYIDRFISDNSLVVGEYKKRGFKCEAIHNGIDCVEKFNINKYDRDSERNKLNIESDDLLIYFIGRLSPEKNPDIFLKAAQRVVKKYKNAKFFIIGDGPMRSDIEKEIASSNNKNIKYLGYQTDIPRYLSAADVFVLPSKIEGFPLSNIEAMAMGVCVISSDVGGVKDAVADGKNGFLVKANSVDDLEKAIEDVIKNKDKLRTVSKEAIKTVNDNFSLEILSQKYNNLYKNIDEK